MQIRFPHNGFILCKPTASEFAVTFNKTAHYKECVSSSWKNVEGGCRQNRPMTYRSFDWALRHPGEFWERRANANSSIFKKAHWRAQWETAEAMSGSPVWISVMESVWHEARKTINTSLLHVLYGIWGGKWWLIGPIFLLFHSTEFDWLSDIR